MPFPSPAFDRRAALKAAAAGLPAWWLAELRAADEPAKPAPKADRPRGALVGCGGRGRGVAGEASKFGTVVAVCDVDATRAAAAAKQFNGATPYADFRKLLEKEKDLAVVVNGTPDHWHTLVNLAALRAGKDVYSEKPLTHTVDEGKRVVAAVRETGRVLQTGTQQRSDPRFRLAVEVVRAGRLGKLSNVLVHIPAGPQEGPFKPAPVPQGLDWDFWQGPAESHEFLEGNKRAHFFFRYWLDYSGGTITDWGAHHNDIALWGLGFDRSGPASIEGRELVKPVPGGFTAPSEFEITYTYPNGVTHRCLSTKGSTGTGGRVTGENAKYPPHGVRFEGSDGWLFVTRGKIEASRPGILSDKFGDNEARLPAVNDHMGNFFDCVKSRKAPICDAEIGHRSASICHLGGIAVQLGRKLRWDPAAEQFSDDKEANGHLAREMRKPWTYDAI